MAEPNSSLAALLAAGVPGAALQHAGGGYPAADEDRFLISRLIEYLQRQQTSYETWPTSVYNPLNPPINSTGALPSYWLYHGIGAQGPGKRDSSVSLIHCGFDELESYRSDVASLARFSQRVDHATWYLYAAIDSADDFPSVERTVPKRTRSASAPNKGWYGRLANQCFARWQSTRDVLIINRSIPEQSERLYRTAFWSLCELTPADSQLKRLFEQDRQFACRELVRHVDAYAGQLALATDLAAALATGDDKSAEEDTAHLMQIQQALLEKAGDLLTLTQAAERLGITRQALHKKIKTAAALGLMFGGTLVVPSFQLVEERGEISVVGDLRKVLMLFTDADAGDWSALQYLVDRDPALGGEIPINLLKTGQAATVIAAARAFLGLDEG